jgi:hypothetical protein
MKSFFLKPSTKLQLHALLGIVIALVPAMMLISMVPPFRDWPLWSLIAVPCGIGGLCMIWFRQCMSPNGTSFKPKWW